MVPVRGCEVDCGRPHRFVERFVGIDGLDESCHDCPGVRTPIPPEGKVQEKLQGVGSQ